MTWTLVAGLVGLALVDSTSIGTLVVPVWLVLSPDRPPARRMLAYLAAIGGFYFLLGVALATAGAAGLASAGDGLRTPLVFWPVLVVGVAMVVLSFRFDSGKRRRRGEPDRTTAWRERALRSQHGTRGLVVLAVSAGALEVLSMLPYLAAIGLLVAAGLPVAGTAGLLAGYCLVMVAPALLLLGVRVIAGARLDPVLHRLDGLLSRYADSAAGWALAIGGFLLARYAAGGLGIIG